LFPLVVGPVFISADNVIFVNYPSTCYGYPVLRIDFLVVRTGLRIWYGPFLAPIRLNGRLARGPPSSGPPNSKQESPRLTGKLPHMVRLVKGARG